MARDDLDLDKLTTLLQQCLARIDEEAYRLQEDGEDSDYERGDRLEDEAATLQELIDSLLVVDLGRDEAVLNDVVTRVTDSCLQEFDVPIVLRTDLCVEASDVAAPASLVAVAVQRAVVLGMAPLQPGDELNLTTRVEHDAAVFEVESLGSQPDRTDAERAETLREFVESLGGQCAARSDGNNLYLVLELPRVMATESSDHG